jgi:hypothetical protein
MTLTSASEQTIQTLEITKTEEIRASIGIVFETLLEQLGPLNETPEGVSLAMKIEPWPGGRWYRDLGNNNGHLWGHVQAIKRPTLLEIFGPLFMSYPATSNVQYRLREEGGVTRVEFAHRAIGLIPPEHRDRINVDKGWSSILTKVRTIAEKRR